MGTKVNKMKNKFLEKRLICLCIIANIFTAKSTYAALKLTFTSPLHHIAENFNLPHSYGYHKNLNDMKHHIRRVLNINTDNTTIDKYISKTFNLNNLNPTYVFRIPDQKNQTLILRKSDFSAPIYPNITSINKFSKTNHLLEQSSSNRYIVKVKSQDVLDELKNEELIFQRNLDDNSEDPDYDDDMRSILEENVKSEQDFITLLNKFNKDLVLKQENKKSSTHLRKDKKQDTTASKDEWSELGLPGWSGIVTNSKDDLAKKERIKPSKSTNDAFAALLQSFDSLSLINIKDTFLTYNKKPQQPVKSNESALKTGESLNQLSSLLLENQKILLNNTGRIPNVRWPITSSRDQHNNDDVFIARANNPFGHSTKWEFRNSTFSEGSPREGRAKRGVLHLYSMIKCATGCDPLQYKGYGCYCGFLGSGRALDGIDRCCKAHDYCYSNANCLFYTEYLVPYFWKCYRGKPLCAVENGEFGGPFSCGTKLCECDRALSKCLRHYYCPKKRPVCTSNPFRLLQNFVMVF